MDVLRFVENYWTVSITNVRKSVIQETVENAIKLHSYRKRVPVENTIFKCWQAIQSSENLAKIQFQSVECPAVRNYNAVIHVLVVAIKDLVKTAK